jgi:tryptophanyl-tRNA synthetase
MKIDPWGTSNIKDYGIALKQFGVSPISEISKKFPKHHFFSRNIIFGHKDLHLILKAKAAKKPFALLTGLMPSGKFHFGHKIIADMIVYYQNMGAECHICVADIESYLTRNIPLDKAREIAIEEYLTNYIALGLKPKKTKFYFQSNGSSKYNTLSKIVAKRTTFNELNSIYGNPTPEKIISIFTQVADILYPQLEENGGPKPTIVPVGADQLPHLNLTRDIASRLKSEFKFFPPSATFNKLMPGLKGTKMSSSDPDSSIFLTDDPSTVEAKIKKYAFSGGQNTLKEHRKKGANLSVDIPYQWLTYLEEDDKKLAKIRDEYSSGFMLTSEIKQILIDKINDFLKYHQKERKKAKARLSKFLKPLD